MANDLPGCVRNLRPNEGPAFLCKREDGVDVRIIMHRTYKGDSTRYLLPRRYRLKSVDIDAVWYYLDYTLGQHAFQQYAFPLTGHQHLGSPRATLELLPFEETAFQPAIPFAQPGFFMPVGALQQLVLDIVLIDDHLHPMGNAAARYQRAFKKHGIVTILSQ